MRIQARFWALDSWDGESGYLKVGGAVWWTRSRSIHHTCPQDGIEPFVGHEPYFGYSIHHKCYFYINVRKAHTAAHTVVKFWSTIDQARSDESWAFSNVRISTCTVTSLMPLTLQITHVNSGDWSNEATTDTDDGALHGIWGNGNPAFIRPSIWPVTQKCESRRGFGRWTRGTVNQGT